MNDFPMGEIVLKFTESSLLRGASVHFFPLFHRFGIFRKNAATSSFFIFLADFRSIQNVLKAAQTL